MSKNYKKCPNELCEETKIKLYFDTNIMDLVRECCSCKKVYHQIEDRLFNEVLDHPIS